MTLYANDVMSIAGNAYDSDKDQSERQIAFMFKWVTAEQLRIAVKTEANPFGEITPEQYKAITKQDLETQAEA
ncbi:hypothetical protein [Lysinibacillus fusiformis]|uniref:hypothetical protein n=1 Tax=Lysinibacillus fusiformis TaxID=28031 RepID=UPI0035BFF665